MKKLLLALSIIALPLTAMAADKPDRMSDATIDAAVKQFGPSFCAKTVDGIKEAAEKVYDCYQKTPKDSPDLEICFLGYNAVYPIIERVNNKSNVLGKESPFKKIIYFSKEERLKNISEILNYPKYKNFSKQQWSDYQSQSIKDFVNKANASCNPSL